ncbi:MAG: hypothetical protein GSR84_07370 [Desulfurococcales archaeon]|nr:hypothetical protein [Desulfurococcales archaeon]
MILRVIGALLLITSLITGMTLAGFTLAGIEPSITTGILAAYTGYGSYFVTADKDNLVVVWLADLAYRSSGADVRADVYKYKIAYNFTVPKGSRPQPAPMVPPIHVATITYTNTTGTTATIVTTQVQVPSSYGITYGGPFKGYYMKECRMYVLTSSDMEKVLKNPDVLARLRKPPLNGDPLLGQAYIKLVESYASHKYIVEEPGVSCSIEETLQERPVMAVIVHLVDPERLSIDAGSIVVPGTLIHSFILNRSSDPLELETPTSRAAIFVRDYLETMANTMAASSTISVRATLEASPMALWRLASIAILGLALMRLDRGERGDLLPGPLRRLARRLGIGRG